MCGTMLRLLLFAAALAAFAQAPKNDYAKLDHWLCRPGLERANDACAAEQSATVVAANGKLKLEKFKPASNPAIDCFYVYPTVSNDTTPNSDMTAGPEEKNVIAAQFARFGKVCRPYAPLYRQVTLTALRAGMAGRPMAADRALGYNDVKDAWNFYLEKQNQGRGVVLIGHSQGSGVLTELIKNEIDGKPVAAKVVSALLLGTNVAVPKGKDVGGAFQKMPLCKFASQTGCVISYVTFRASAPPPANSLFGRVRGDGLQAACVNPAALAGGKGELRAYLASRGRGNGSAADPKPWATPAREIATPFVSVPGLLTAECVANDKGSYLAVTVNADPQDPRTDEITGDVVTNGQVQNNWGLHLIDVQVAMGNLVDVVGAQAKAYRKKKSLENR